MARRAKRGYGSFMVGSRRIPGSRRPVQAHRLAYELAVGPIAPGLVVRHFECDNPPCCNPAHLRQGTQLDNAADMVAKGRQAAHERNPNAKLATQGVAEIRAKRTGGAKTVDLALEYGVSQSLISQICRGLLWRPLAIDLAAVVAS